MTINFGDAIKQMMQEIKIIYMYDYCVNLMETIMERDLTEAEKRKVILRCIKEVKHRSKIYGHH